MVQTLVETHNRSRPTPERSVLKAFIFLLVVNAFFGAPAFAQSIPTGKSGFYDPAFAIGVDKSSGTVTGYFESSTGWDETTKAPRFSCMFFLSGKLQGDAYQITTWFPGEKDNHIKGQLKFVAGAKTRAEMRIRLEGEHGGCWNVYPLREMNDDKLPLTRRGEWVAVGVVSSRRAFFHRAPDLQAREKAYLTRGDMILVYKVEQGWVDAEYIKGWMSGEFGQTKRGWIKEADLFSPYQ